MERVDVVLYNECGCEIARESISNERTYEDIVGSFMLYPGDRIEIKECWHEC